MIKNILVPLTGFVSDARAMEAAYIVGEPSAANVVCLHVRPSPMQIIGKAATGQFATRMGNVELIHAIEEEAYDRSVKARDVFRDFTERAASGEGALQARGMTFTWWEVEGDPISDTTSMALYSDLIVLGRAPKNGEFCAASIANILVRSGRPVLLMPEHPVDTIGSRIAVAWKETAEAARAVTAAMPLLSQAKRIAVIHVNETAPPSSEYLGSAARLSKQLAHHGLLPEAQDVAFSERPAAETLIETARKFGADLLVAGAYSHSRFREFVFGGFTRQVLGACELPVLLLH